MMSEVLMYGSAQWVMPFCNTFSTRATRKISAWGLVTEKIPWKRKGGMTEEAEHPIELSSSLFICCLKVFYTVKNLQK